MNKTSSGLLVAICMVAVLLSSCKKNDTPVIATGDAKIKVVNTVSNSNAQDFYQGNNKLTSTPVAYGESSDYLKASGGVSNVVSFRDKDGGPTKASYSTSLTPNVAYTVFYFSDPSGTSQIIGLDDDNTAPATGKAKIRFMNIVYNNTLNIAVTGGNAVMNPLQYGYVSNYNLVDAGVSLTISAVGGTTTAVIPTTAFESGKVYTVWIDGSISTSIVAHIVKHN
ncbi:DUF4397 domain-containing protein [Pedobacter sp. KR3-3]|uniref:DUF4397 domain-containing protein n=1 Tax=Pedobacter albus TaxID=3113905 RepID=A0ABU7I3R9_9SPHI|nr:DUF4397 domain-containing protein [Pedobacter sp. KR3-3]MEE1944116.1 DUF4397 domain-containing protein [Pedobacter sp. KR3-3]